MRQGLDRTSLAVYCLTSIDPNKILSHHKGVENTVDLTHQSALEYLMQTNAGRKREYKDQDYEHMNMASNMNQLYNSGAIRKYRKK